MSAYRVAIVASLAIAAFSLAADVGAVRAAVLVEWWHPWLRALGDAALVYLGWMGCKEQHGLLGTQSPKDGAQ